MNTLFKISQCECCGLWWQTNKSQEVWERSITTRMTVLPGDSGKSVRKSRVIWDHGHWGGDSDIGFPTRNVPGTLACAQEEQEPTLVLISEIMFGHQYLAWRSSGSLNVLRLEKYEPKKSVIHGTEEVYRWGQRDMWLGHAASAGCWFQYPKRSS